MGFCFIFFGMNWAVPILKKAISLQEGFFSKENRLIVAGQSIDKSNDFSV